MKKIQIKVDSACALHFCKTAPQLGLLDLSDNEILKRGDSVSFVFSGDAGNMPGLAWRIVKAANSPYNYDFFDASEYPQPGEKWESPQVCDAFRARTVRAVVEVKDNRVIYVTEGMQHTCRLDIWMLNYVRLPDQAKPVLTGDWGDIDTTNGVTLDKEQAEAYRAQTSSYKPVMPTLPEVASLQELERDAKAYRDLIDSEYNEGLAGRGKPFGSGRLAEAWQEGKAERERLGTAADKLLTHYLQRAKR